MYNKAVDNYSHALGFVSECFMTEEMCDKAIDTYPYTIKFVSEYHKTQKMCNKVVNRCCFCI